MNKRFKVVNLSHKWSKIGSWKETNPYSIYFVYSVTGEKLIVKGGLKDVESWMEENLLTTPYMFFRTLWYKGEFRGGIDFGNMPYNMSVIMYNFVTNKFKGLIIYQNGKEILKKPLKRFPRKFPIELKQILEDNNKQT